MSTSSVSAQTVKYQHFSRALHTYLVSARTNVKTDTCFLTKIFVRTTCNALVSSDASVPPIQA
eukprot:scaffold171858_cov29-Prasinocladus_malaysianus.AAC.1